jgi:hypothetical protein
VCSSAVCGRGAAAGARFLASSQGFDQVLANSSNNVVGHATQRVYLPESPATLSFRVREGDSGALGVDTFLQVRIDNVLVVEPDPEPGIWEPVSVSVPNGVTGDTLSASVLEFKVVCDNLSSSTAECDQVDVDSVSLVTGQDLEAPQTTLTAAPPAQSTKRLATFRFTSSEPGSTFACKFDAQAWATCASPVSRRMKPGPHTFRVRATDASGNTDATPDSHTWRVLRS